MNELSAGGHLEMWSYQLQRPARVHVLTQDYSELITTLLHDYSELITTLLHDYSALGVGPYG